MQLMVITSYAYSINFDCGDLHEEFDYIYDGEITKDCIANVWHEYNDDNDFMKIVRCDGYVFPPFTYQMIDNIDGDPVTSNQELVQKISVMLRTR